MRGGGGLFCQVMTGREAMASSCIRGRLDWIRKISVLKEL